MNSFFKFCAGIAAMAAICVSAEAQPASPTAIDLPNLAAIGKSAYGVTLHVQGNLTPGDGGESYFVRNGVVCSPDGFNILKDISGNCFYRQSPGSKPITPELLGVIADEISVTNGVLTGTAFSTSSYCFTPRDIGKAIVVWGVGPTVDGIHRATFPSTVTGINFPCGAVLANAATVNGTALTADFGTDNFAAMNLLCSLPSPVEFGSDRIMIANPGDTYNNNRTLSCANAGWHGAGAVIFAGMSGQAADSGNQFAFTAQSVYLDGAISFNGEYGAYGTSQFNLAMITMNNINEAYIGPGIYVTNVKGTCFHSSGNTDERNVGSYNWCGDYYLLNTSPTDPEFGRNFAVWQDTIHGHLNDDGMKTDYAAQSGVFLESTDIAATVSLRGSKMRHSGFYGYDIEQWPGTLDLSGTTCYQDPSVTRNYSLILGCYTLTNIANIVADKIYSYGADGHDFSLNPLITNVYNITNVNIGSITAISGPNTNQMSNVYLGGAGTQTQKYNIGTIIADQLTMYPQGSFTNGAANLMENGIWVDTYTSTSKAAANGTYNLVMNNFHGDYALASIRHGQADVVNVLSNSGPMLFSAGPDFAYNRIVGGGSNGSYIGDLGRSLLGPVTPYNLTTPKDPYPFDYSQNAGVHATWNGSLFGAVLNNVNTGNVGTHSLALDMGYLYLVGLTMQNGGSCTKMHVGIPGGFASNVTFLSSSGYVRQWVFTRDFLSTTLPPPAQALLTFTVPTSECVTGTVSAIINSMSLIPFVPLTASGYQGVGPYAEDFATRFGNELSTIYTNDH